MAIINRETHGDELEQIWQAIFELAEKHKAMPVNYLWAATAGDWLILLNGSKIPIKHEGFELLPFNCAVWFNGWIAGHFSPFKGTIAAGSLANATTLVAAIRKEIESVRGRSTITPTRKEN